ncbi:MAG: hypothetical protein ABIQ31_27120 [Ferruginibacter sp.]
MEKNILLILGHPSQNSYCKALLDAYQTGVVSAGATCKTIYISQLKKVVFGYVGFKPINFSAFGFIRKSTEALRNNWLKKVEQSGSQFK